MSIVEDALLWDGVYANIGMYALFEGDPNLQECSFATGDVEPIKVWPPFPLEDELNTLPRRSLVNYEVRLSRIPDDLAGYLEVCTGVAKAKGAVFIWFQFEASFNFDYLFTDEIARQIYYIVDRYGRAYKALEDEILLSDGWKSIVLEKRLQIVDMT